MREDPFQAAVRLEQMAQHREARSRYRRLSGGSPNSAAILAGIGRCSTAMHEYADAERALLSATRIEPTNAEYLTSLAYCYSLMGRGDDARAWAGKALEVSPGHAPALHVIAEVHRTAGEPQAAYDLIAPVAARDRGDASLQIFFARLASSVGKDEEAIEVLKRLDEGAGLADSVRAWLHYALGGVFDKLERYDDAWASFEIANRLSPTSFDLGPYLFHMDALTRAWTPERVESVPRASVRTELPVFIVGMPRSGSSLLEQILAACDGVEAGGERAEIPIASSDLLYPEGVLPVHDELISKRIERVRRASLDRISRQIEKSLRAIAPDAMRITDKNLSNYIYIPLIWMLFPGATIIHVRRDPLDTCLSCFFQYFGPGMEFANDLVSLGTQYRYYERLMEHWHALFPGQVVDVEYEALVEDPRTHAPRVVDAVGVSWSDACLRFHERRDIVTTASAEQVRKPIYKSSVNRWKNYEKHLDPLRRALERV